MRFENFNRVANPHNENCYKLVDPNGSVLIDKASFSEVRQVITNNPNAAVYMNIPKGLMILETDCKAVVDTIINNNEQVFVAKNNNVYQIYSLNAFDKNTTNNVLACGCSANTLVNNKSGKEILLPFHIPQTTNDVFDGVEILYGETIGKTPIWLTPMYKSSSQYQVGLQLPIVNNIQKNLAELVKMLEPFGKQAKVNIIKFVNLNLVQPKLDEEDLNEFLDDLNDLFAEDFFYKRTFLHYKFGDYLINLCNIKRDSKSKDIFCYDEKKNIYVNDQDHIRGIMTKQLPMLKKHDKDEVVNYINDNLIEDSVEFNSNPMNIVFKNGILHLDEMIFEEMTPMQLESVQINAEWDPTAHSDTVDEFFKTATCGDKETEQLLYESIGYSMLKTVELAKMFMLVGDGRNGKSTFIDLVKAVLGKQNCTSLAPKDLEKQFRVAMLKGKLASLCGDISAQPIKENDVMKQLISGDDVTFEEKYKGAVTDSSFATFFFACNKLPRTSDNSYGNSRRWVIVPFNADLTNVSNVDGFSFKKKLLEQESINYVAYKAVTAIYKLLSTTKEFANPVGAQEALKQYIIDCSSVLSWAQDMYKCDLALLQNAIDNKGAYTSYSSWCDMNNRSPKNSAEWRKELLSTPMFKGLKIQ